MQKHRTPFDQKPIFLLVDALRKAGSVIELAKELHITDGAVYNWIDGIHLPSRDSVNALRHYLYGEGEVKPVPKPVKKPEDYARTFDKPKTFTKTVEITRVFLGGSGNFVAFGTTENCSVFITPVWVKKIAEQVGSIYEGDFYEFEVMVDITKRSDYITHRYIGPA